MLLPGYEARKAAQVAAYFALKNGGQINVLKLAKLLYLTEREFMSRYDVPMFYDRLVSMPDGPVTSITLNLINGHVEDDSWSKFVAPRKGYDICVTSREIGFDELDELSQADVEVLDYLWEKFGTWTQYELRDWTHRKENVPEWRDPCGSSTPIEHAKIFGYLNKPNSQVLADGVDEHRSFFKMLEEADAADA